jgi:hypothetical protein
VTLFSSSKASNAINKFRSIDLRLILRILKTARGVEACLFREYIIWGASTLRYRLAPSDKLPLRKYRSFDVSLALLEELTCNYYLEGDHRPSLLTLPCQSGEGIVQDFLVDCSVDKLAIE